MRKPVIKDVMTFDELAKETRNLKALVFIACRFSQNENEKSEMKRMIDELELILKNMDELGHNHVNTRTNETW